MTGKKACFFETPPIIILSYDCNRDCFYCSAKGLKELRSGKIKTVEFGALLDWLARQGIHMAGLSGGEPTLHPKFNELINLASEKGFSLEIATNNLFGENKRKAFECGPIKSIAVHFDEPGFYSPKELDLFHQNLDFLSGLPASLGLAHNIFSKKTSHDHIFEACQKYGIKKVSMSIVTPGVLKQNYFVKIREIDGLFQKIVSFAEQAESMGIEFELNNVLPRCAFSEEHSEFLEEKGLLKSKCLVHSEKFNPIVTIQPDLSVNACSRTSINRKNVLEFKSLRELKESMEREFEELRAEPLIEKCLECKYWIKKCQGGCLVYKDVKKNENTNQ